jgi:hypothetical protein
VVSDLPALAIAFCDERRPTLQCIYLPYGTVTGNLVSPRDSHLRTGDNAEMETLKGHRAELRSHANAPCIDIDSKARARRVYLDIII